MIYSKTTTIADILSVTFRVYFAAVISFYITYDKS